MPTKSTMLVATMKQSNLFHAVLKYAPGPNTPIANILINISSIKNEEKMISHQVRILQRVVTQSGSVGSYIANVIQFNPITVSTV